MFGLKMVRFGSPDLRTGALGVKRVRGSVSPYSRGRAVPKKVHFGQKVDPGPRCPGSGFWARAPVPGPGARAPGPGPRPRARGRSPSPRARGPRGRGPRPAGPWPAQHHTQQHPKSINTTPTYRIALRMDYRCGICGLRFPAAT